MRACASSMSPDLVPETSWWVVRRRQALGDVHLQVAGFSSGGMQNAQGSPTHVASLNRTAWVEPKWREI